MKLRYPKGILGGILKYGFNPTAIIHAWFTVFAIRDAERMRQKRLAREALQKQSESQVENHDGERETKDESSDHRGSGQ